MSIPYAANAALSDADFLAWAGADGAILLDYQTNEPLRLDWKWKFDVWQRATLKMRGMLLRGAAVVAKGYQIIAPGPARIFGLDAADDMLTAGHMDNADPSAFADVIFPAGLGAGAIGIGYFSAEFTSSLDTTGSTIGDVVWVATAGAITLTKPTAPNVYWQKIGYVKTKANPGVLIGFVHPPEHVPLKLVQTDNATINLDGSGKLQQTGTAKVVWYGTLPAAPGSPADGGEYYDNVLIKYRKFYNAAWHDVL